MTTKQLLLSALILCTTANIMVGMEYIESIEYPKYTLKTTLYNKDYNKSNNPHGYPGYPFEDSCSDWCNFNIDKYKKEYRGAIKRELDACSDEKNWNNGTWLPYLKNSREEILASRIKVIKKYQKQCPNIRNKQIENAIEIGFNQ